MLAYSILTFSSVGETTELDGLGARGDGGARSAGRARGAVDGEKRSAGADRREL
ncbi:hypothetical protein [Paenibacillus silvestris]|uniref:hypothetical protein n=1 Tax=Paenibacillus silvestris TaxID=2606219 RepID=UPI001372D386|nr:hypothetical protein [Paenibacillus silvestris]